MPGHRIRPFAIETQQAKQAPEIPMAIRAVAAAVRAVGVQFIKHRTLSIAGDQNGLRAISSTSLLSQQEIPMLKNAVLRHALDLGRQTVLEIETLGVVLICLGAMAQTIQCVVMVAAE